MQTPLFQLIRKLRIVVILQIITIAACCHGWHAVVPCISVLENASPRSGELLSKLGLLRDPF